MANKYDIAVFIGRLQPPHWGHISVILKGLEEADHVVVLIGSATAPRCHRNPFKYAEREQMLISSIPSSHRDRVIVYPLEDSTYNDAKWIINVQTQVDRACWKLGFTSEPKIALVGHNKDESSFYLKMFPQWDSIEAPNYKGLNSTQVRTNYFSNIGHMWISNADGHKIGDLPQDHIVPTPTKEFLSTFLNTPEYKLICEEYEFVLKYKLSWAHAPYEPTFVTVDAVVTQGGHVLLVRRKASPGKGLWAMPGGFLNPKERIKDAVIRELREETKIKVPDPVLRGSVIDYDFFDDPNRSARGRTITHAFLIKLKDENTLPRVVGSDDADKAKWIQISKIRRDEMFEDHFDIIDNMIARI
jgi:bifunctional NMN adenylyltransferase/nudix hydrolase